VGVYMSCSGFSPRFDRAGRRKRVEIGKFKSQFDYTLYYTTMVWECGWETCVRWEVRRGDSRESVRVIQRFEGSRKQVTLRRWPLHCLSFPVVSLLCSVYVGRGMLM
jgi:hypothetical protein